MRNRSDAQESESGRPGRESSQRVRFSHCSLRAEVPLTTTQRRRKEHCKNPNAAGHAVWVVARDWGRAP
jgi:hypothetical protein